MNVSKESSTSLLQFGRGRSKEFPTVSEESLTLQGLTWMYIFACAPVCMFECMSVSMYAFACLRVFVCVCVYLVRWCVFVYICVVSILRCAILCVLRVVSFDGN